MNKFYMVVGPSGSGKSTYTRLLQKTQGIDIKIFSSDDIREELYGDVSIQKDHNKVFQILHKRIKEALEKGESTIYDACNLSARRRKAFLQEINKYNCKKICIVVASDYNSCVRNQEKRNRKVPADVIRRQIKSFQLPDKTEGWDDIQFYSPFHNFSLDEELQSLMTESHDNPHHFLTIGHHMIKCANWASVYDYPFYIRMACKYHDIGKGFCKTFRNSKNEITNIAHYYCHENVSTYMILSSKEFNEQWSEKDRQTIPFLVQHHMELYNCKEKFREKYKDFNNLSILNTEILHELDIKSH